MKRNTAFVIIILALITSNAYGFWIWAPGDKKLVNPKYAVKDSPGEQFKWAMSFFEQEDYKRAGEEFQRLVTHYKDSQIAPEAQYYAALSYQKTGKYLKAFELYQAVIKNYPYSEKLHEIIANEYELGVLFYNRSKARLMGMELMDDVEKAIEVFSAIIENVPYSEYTDKAQFMIGLSHKKIMQYNEAGAAFETLVQEYPNSELAEQAKYEVAQCMYLASLDAVYDQEIADDAIDELKKYADESDDGKLKKEAAETIKKLNERKAATVFETAEFYLKQKKYRSARIYYKEITDNYYDTVYVEPSRKALEEIKGHLEEKTDGKNK